MRVVLLGEQATGKSSLLVALYGALVNRRADSTSIVRTIDEVAFLSRGLAALGRRESVRRTEVDAHARLLVELAHGGAVVTIELPDRSGEILRNMIEARIWDPDLRRQVGDAAAAMLFLRADHFEPAAPAAPDHDDDSGLAPVPPAPTVWSPAQMPPDVRAVDLLQAVLEERPTALPLAVIVSAWDLVADAAAQAPPVWLSQRAPLLDQFLSIHSGQLPHAVFGVSAQGGDFADRSFDDADRADPWDRAFLIGPDGVRRTLAEPIRWLIDEVAACTS